MTRVVVHIGTPKTGTTSIQHALAANQQALQDAGVVFMQAGRARSAHNALANAISRHGEAHKFRADFEAEFAEVVAKDSTRVVLVSSEIFSLLEPQVFRAALPVLAKHPLQIIVYLRRQDQYAEAFYKQRLKNGRLKVPFEAFLQSETCTRITDYNALLEGWAQTYPEAEIVPRIYDRAGFAGGDIVADFAGLIGVPAAALVASTGEQNMSPSREVINILLALAPHFKGAELRAMFRTVKGMGLAGFSGKGDLFTADARRTYCQQFQDADEVLRERWFDARPVIFARPSGSASAPPTPDPEQGRVLLSAFLQVAFDMKSDS